MNELFRFGPFRLDPNERILTRGETAIGLTPKAFDALVLLVRNSGHLLDKDELMEQLWPKTVVEDGNLTQCIYVLRRALGEREGQSEPAYIETVPRRGYRFVAKVERVSEEEPAGFAEPPVPGNAEERSGLWRRWKFAAAAIGTLAVFAFALLWRKPAHGNREDPAALVPPSIAVLPFLNLSGASNNDYLSEGITEELTTALAEIHSLRVVARTSAFQFRDKGEDVRKIGTQLGVGAVLEGSLSRSANKLHVTAQLVSTQNGYHLWSGTYDGQRDELYSIEEQIVKQTSRLLGVASREQEPSFSGRRTENSEAHDLYLEGRYFWYKRDLRDMEKSIQYFRAAIKKDPNYALAYWGMADTYVVMAGNGQKPYQEVMAPARAAVKHALDLSPSLAEAHVTQAMLYPPWGSQAIKEQDFRRAVELSPNYATAHHWFGVILTPMGRFQDAEKELREAQILDPLSPMITEGLAENLYYWRRYDSAIEQVRHIQETGSPVGDTILGLSYMQKGMYPEAIAVFRNLPQGDEAAKNLTYLACAYAASGQTEEARKLLAQATKSGKGYVPPSLMARVEVLLGDKESALRWLEIGYKQPDPTMTIKVDPVLDPLRGDPRFSELLGKMSLSD